MNPIDQCDEQAMEKNIVASSVLSFDQLWGSFRQFALKVSWQQQWIVIVAMAMISMIESQNLQIILSMIHSWLIEH